MKSLYQYLVLLILGLGIIAVLGVTLSGPVIYSLEKDVFPSLFHENTDALKVKEFNSTTDILPLMQDLLDYDGPIMLNINLRDMDQVRYYLDQYSKNNIRLRNLVVNLDMTDSEMDEFSKSKQLQQKLLAELMNSTISMDELDSLMITYRDDSGMIMSLEMQREAILKRMQEISEQYRLESEKTRKIADNAGLDTSSAKEAVKEVQRFVDSVDKKTPVITNPLPRIPTLSLLVNPETGKYGDSIRFSGVYISSPPEKIQYPLTFHIDSGAVVSATTDQDGIYSTLYEIGEIPPGEHSVYATSGITSSAIRTFSVTPVNSTTSLDIRALYNKPEILCSGLVLANRPVRNAPVDIMADYPTILRQTTNKNGAYQAQIRLSPGTHNIQARFVNATYPIYSSGSPVYEVEAGRDSILSIRLLDSNMSADELSLTLEPASASYNDVINITGFLSGKDPKNRIVDLFIDGVYSLGLQTGPDGSYAGTYAVEKIRAGNHTLFAHYREPEAGEIYSPSRPFVVNAAESVTLLDIGMADDGIGVICTGNVSARGIGVSTAPVELVWDSRNIIRIPADETGSFRQKISLPVGNHSIFARFTSQDYPLIPSRSVTYTVTVPPPLDLFVRPPVAYYRDTLTIGGTLQGLNRSYQDIRVFIDGKRTTTVRTDAQGLFSTSSQIENISAGEHTVQAFSGEYSSDPQKFLVLPVASDLVMSAVLIPDSSRVLCLGTLTENGRGVGNAPIQIIGDDRPVSETRTDRYGRFEDTITLPLGKHRIRAVFNDTSQFPLNASRSRIFEIDVPGIPGDLTLTVMPDTGTFGERLTINGTLSSRTNSGETVHLIIDGRTTADTKTGTRGDYSFLYLIDRLSFGSHTVEAVCNNFRSDPRSIFISPVDSKTTLSLRQIPGTPRIACSGTVTADNRPLRLAPVALVIDDKNIIRTETDESGNYTEIIPASAGMHRVQAQFNSTDIFPVNPSKSTVVEITILPELSLDVRPSSGIYNDTLLFEGTLIRPGNPESTVDLFIDNNLLTTVKTDRTGRYSYAMTIEQMPAGNHPVQAQSAGLYSDVKVFQVLPVHSLTTLTITPVNNSALYECTGRVAAINHTGEMIRKPLTIKDAEAILDTFWDNPLSRAGLPVRFAPVEIIANNATLLQTMTDAEGQFSRRVAFPEGDNRVTAQFINDSYPIFSSTSEKRVVNVPTADISVQNGTETPPQRIPESLVIPVILLLFVGGAGYYLNRRSALFSRKSDSLDLIAPPGTPGEGPAAPESPGGTGKPADTSPPELPAEDPLFIRYLRIQKTDGLSTAARAVYVHFTGIITKTLPVRNHQALTPREFLRSCEEKPFVAAFSSFISLYERVRYGGIENSETTGEFEESIRKTDLSLEGEDH